MAEKTKIKVLVIAPRFPSINQPWIDTYIEQLLKNKLNFLICSNRKNPSNFSEKVNKLKLQQKVKLIDLKPQQHLKTILALGAKSPKQLIHILWKSYIHTKRLKQSHRLDTIPTFIKLAGMGSMRFIFSDLTVIHSHSEVLSFEFLFLAAILDIPILYTFHGLTPKGVPPLAAAKRKALYSMVKTVFVNTRFAKKQACRVGCPEEKIIILPQGLPIEEFPYAPQPAPKDDTPLKLLSVGRFDRDKGYRYSIVAAARLKKMGIKISYAIVGVGPEKNKLNRLILRLGLTEHVMVHKGLSSEKLKSLYREAHIFILASISNEHDEHVETQGVVLQEAQASGCITVATRVGGIPECIHDGIDGILVKDKSSRAIASTVQHLHQNTEIWNQLQQNGRKNVEENFSADIIGKRMAEILRKTSKTEPEQ